MICTSAAITLIVISMPMPFRLLRCSQTHYRTLISNLIVLLKVLRRFMTLLNTLPLPSTLFFLLYMAVLVNEGGIQVLLEKSNIPFVGTSSNQCRKAFDKYEASLELDRQGYITVPGFPVQGNELEETDLSTWFTENLLDTKLGKVVVKPTRAGSSIGVAVAYGVTDALSKAGNYLRGY